MEEQKETFINILSHDLRTPLLAQVQALNMLLGGEFGRLNDAQREILQTITESEDDLLGMVSDILAYYKIETGEIAFNFELVDIKKIIENICVDLDKKLKQKSLTVKIFSSQKENIVYADAELLSKAITYIVENCITYAYKSTTMTIRLHCSEKNLCITVTTKGIQLPQSVLDYLFDFNSKKSLTHTKIGYGMKLNLALKILELHSGGIVAKNGAGEGVIFDIILPIKTSLTSKFIENIKIA